MWLGQILLLENKIIIHLFTELMKKSTTCLYNSVMTFSLDGQTMKFLLDNKGQTYYNGIKGGDDACYDLNTAVKQ
jgi:hypothetical protein